MKKTILLSSLLALASSCPHARAGDPGASLSSHPHCHSPRPDSHAPIGVMYDHAHGAGGLMVGYRYAWEHDEGLLKGSSKLSDVQAFRERSPGGEHYTAIPLDMDMHMHMLEIMYAPADWVTLMLMPMYMEMSMTMESRGHGGQGPGHGHGHGHGHGGHGNSTIRSHSTSGWSDTVLAAMFPMVNQSGHKLLLNLGLSMPTGSVDEMHHGMLTHYMMQLGSGTWDLIPGFTYAGYAENLSWGLQSLVTWRLESENSSGYRLGDAVDTTAWVATPLADWVSLSGRIAWRHEGEIKNHYNAPHHHSSPPDFQANYGGDRLDLGLGLNFIVPEGGLKGHRLAIEAMAPVFQDVNGIQLEREISLFAGWQFAF